MSQWTGFSIHHGLYLVLKLQYKLRIGYIHACGSKSLTAHQHCESKPSVVLQILKNSNTMLFTACIFVFVSIYLFKRIITNRGVDGTGGTFPPNIYEGWTSMVMSPQYFSSDVVYDADSSDSNCCLLYFNANIMCSFTKKSFSF